MQFKVVGEAPNIQLVRLNDKGEALTARPASPEELSMYQELERLRAGVQALNRELARVQELLDHALVFAPELADCKAPERFQKLLFNAYGGELGSNG